MMIYSDGAVTVSHDNYIVTGVGVDWTGTIQPGWFIAIESLIGAFQIASVTPTTLVLTKRINLGTISNAAGLSFIAFSEFTPFYRLTIPGAHDPDKITPIQKALERFDTELNALM